MHARILLLLVAAVVAAACTGGEDGKDGDCSGPPPPVGGSGFAGGGGTPTPVPTAEIVLRTTAGGVVVATDGSPAAVTFAPQGGFILLAGVRTAGMDVCLEITAAIKDPAQGDAVVSLEMRPAQQEDGGDGWSYPDEPSQLYNWANLPACQTAALTHDFVGDPYELEITATDGESTSSARRTIVPYCAFDDPFCEELCTLAPAGS